MFDSIFSGRSPSSLNTRTFSPVRNVWVPIVNILEFAASFCINEGPVWTLNTFEPISVPLMTDDPVLTTLSVILISAVFILPLTLSDNTSFDFAPTR